MLDLFILPGDPSLLSYGLYTPRLVVLSVLVAIFSSWMGLQMRYNPWMFGLSIVVAVVLATLALWVRFGLSNVRGLTESKRLLLAAIVMGCAISGMHYTGMEAARFVGHPVASSQQNGST